MNDHAQMIGDMTADTALCNLLSIITDKPSDEVSDIVQRDFKSVHHVLKATPEQLNRLDSSDAIEAIHYVNKIVQSIEEAKIREQELLSSYTAVLSYIRTRLLGYQEERFLCLYLDKSNRLIHVSENIGTIDRCTVYVREVIKTSFMCGATALLVAHQHPSGSASFSQADIDITKKIVAAADVFDITVHDHYLVADDQILSMRTLGLM